MQKFTKLAGAASVAVLMFTGAALAQDAGKACEITDVGGIDDRGFNETAFKGAQSAASELGWTAQYLESQAETDYEPNIAAYLADDCDIIITVGFLMGDATKVAAEANPDQKFSIIDFAYDPVLPNVLGQLFATEQGGYLAGYLAAGVSKTGTVGTFGGVNIPPVTGFMDGFVRGVRHYNEVKGTDVKVLGWDPDTKEGLFTNNFESLDDGRSFAQSLYDEGADIVLPVAGPVGLGSAALAAEVGADKLMIIGVDSDQVESNPDQAGVYLTSILKRMDATTAAVIKSVADGTFAGGVTIGTLENDGVGLAPYHELDSVVPAELKAEVEALKAEIIAGTIDVSK
jgi:basic membrane protein A